MAVQTESRSLEHRRIGDLNGSEVLSAKPIWVLWFVVTTQGRFMCLKERRRVCRLSECVFWSERTFWVLGFLLSFFFFFFGVSFVPWMNGCLFKIVLRFFLFFFFFFLIDKRVLSEGFLFLFFFCWVLLLRIVFLFFYSFFNDKCVCAWKGASLIAPCGF